MTDSTNKKKFNVAFVSDVHTDFYIPSKHSGHQLEKRMVDFIDNELCLKEADILVFAGDNSHYPQQNKLMLEMIAARKMYKKIFVTFGNHDQYLISNSQRKAFKTSWHKIENLKEICEGIDTVEFLDGNIVEVDGIKIGGAGMWYDFSYGLNQCDLHEDEMMQIWKNNMTDSRLIVGKDAMWKYDDFGGWSYSNYGRKPKVTTFNPLKFFEKEKEKLEKIIEECDIFVSHIGPVVPNNLPAEHMNAITGCYFFDGEEYLLADKAPKLWIWGHTHIRYDFKVNNTWLMCNPLGYKDEVMNHEIVVVDLFDLDL